MTGVLIRRQHHVEGRHTGIKQGDRGRFEMVSFAVASQQIPGMNGHQQKLGRGKKGLNPESQRVPGPDVTLISAF